MKFKRSPSLRRRQENQVQRIVVGTCPVCGESVLYWPSCFSCSDPVCSFDISRSRVAKYKRGPLTIEEMTLLLKGKTVEFQGLVRKNGKIVTKWGNLVERREGQWVLRLTMGRPLSAGGLVSVD